MSLLINGSPAFLPPALQLGIDSDVMCHTLYRRAWLPSQDKEFKVVVCYRKEKDINLDEGVDRLMIPISGHRKISLTKFITFLEKEPLVH